MGAWNLELRAGKECTLVRKVGERDVPGWIRGEGANKSDVKACLLWGYRVREKL